MARGAELVSLLRQRLSRLSQATAAPAGLRPRVAVVEWLAPPMLAGHWVPETIEAAGGQALGPAPGASSPYTTWDEARRLAPDAVVVAPCGFDLERTRDEARLHLDSLRSLAARRILLLDGNAYLNRPGPRIVEAAETIAAWLRGETIPEARGVTLDAAVAAASG
jgi:iron complex transport system substrate-binding protein